MTELDPESSQRRMWHVVITTAGHALPVDKVRESLERLADRHQFLLSARYAADRAEVRYWDESAHVRDIAARSFSVWTEYSEIAALPPWEVVGLEVIERDAFHARLGGRPGRRAGDPDASGLASGGIHPF
ncbi:MAG: hypothetical protein WBC76_00040 [Actinomycetes bacterium]